MESKLASLITTNLFNYLIMKQILHETLAKYFQTHLYLISFFLVLTMDSSITCEPK